MVRTRYTSLLILLLAFSSVAAQSRLQQGAGDQPLPDFEWVEGLELDPAWLESRAGQPEAEKEAGLSMRFFAWGREFDIRLQPARLFAQESRNVWVGADGYRIEEEPQQIFFVGELRNDPGSQVHLIIQDEELEGLVMSGDDFFFLEPAKRYFPAAPRAETVAYRLDSLALLGTGHQCSLESGGDERFQPEFEPGLPQVGAAFRALLDDLRLLAGNSNHREIELRLVADSYYYQTHRTSSALRIQGIIHLVNAIYERQAGLTFRITETRVWTSRSQDQVGSSIDPGDLLDEFSTSEQVAGNDLVHLFTGRNLEGGAVGVARVAGICNQSQATSISQDLSNAQLRTILAAHELGHNLGSRHDGQRSCSEVPSGFIMWPILSASFRQLSDCSLGSITRRLERAQCVPPLGGPPLPAPQIIAPEGQVPAPLPSFEWQPVQGAQSYRVQVYDESDDRMIIDQDVLQEFFQPSDPLTRRHTYRWRTAAADSRGAGEQSAWHYFEIEALEAPQATAPSGIIHTSRPRFRWKGVDGAASYRLEVMNEDSGEDALLQETQLKEFQPHQSLKGARFRWRISSLDEAGSASPGPWMRFAVRSRRPSSGPRDRP